MKKVLIFLFIFVLSCSVRLAYMSSHPRSMEGDELAYDDLAVKLVETKRYLDPGGNPTSYRPPLYPAFLALIYLISGHNYFMVQIIQIIISSLTVCLFYLIAEKIFNSLTAFITVIVASFYMTFVACPSLLYTETLFSFLLAWLTFLIIVMDRADIIRFCIIGFLCGFLTLIKPWMLFMPLICGLFLAPKMRKKMMSVKRISISIAGLLLCFTSVLLPWSIRNYNVHRKFVLVSTNMGVNFYHGICSSQDKIFNPGEDQSVWKAVHAIPDEVGKNNFFIRTTLNIYKKRPLFALKMLVIRFLFFWNFIDWDILGGDTIHYHYIFIFPFALVGAFFAIKNRRRDVLVILIIMLYLLGPLLLFPLTVRSRMPIDGYIVLLGCYGIYEFFNRQRQKIYPLITTGAYFLLSYLLYRYALETKYFIKTLMENLGLWY